MMPESSVKNAHIRIARATNDFAKVKQFYIDGLGFDILYEFKDHDGFNGIMLGLPSHAYHLEFTQKHGHDGGRAPTKDDLLIFYLPEPAKWKAALGQMMAAGFEPVPSFNPYWDRTGKTFEDCDGYRVVLQNAGWNL